MKSHTVTTLMADSEFNCRLSQFFQQSGRRSVLFWHLSHLHSLIIAFPAPILKILKSYMFKKLIYTYAISTKNQGLVLDKMTFRQTDPSTKTFNGVVVDELSCTAYFRAHLVGDLGEVVFIIGPDKDIL